jgi:hypothetical protein
VTNWKRVGWNWKRSSALIVSTPFLAITARLTATKSRGTLHEEFNSLIQATGAGPFTFLDEVIHSAQNYQRIVEILTHLMKLKTTRDCFDATIRKAKPIETHC